MNKKGIELAYLLRHDKTYKNDGIDFFLSNNNVWLTKYIDPKYILGIII